MTREVCHLKGVIWDTRFRARLSDARSELGDILGATQHKARTKRYSVHAERKKVGKKLPLQQT